MNPATPETPLARPLLQQRCYHHGDREAAARCPGCGRYYCRECVSLYDHRLLCAGCIRATVASPPLPARSRWAFVVPALQLTAGFLLLWMIFFVSGSILLSLPSSFQLPPERGGHTGGVVAPGQGSPP